MIAVLFEHEVALLTIEQRAGRNHLNLGVQFLGKSLVFIKGRSQKAGLQLHTLHTRFCQPWNTQGVQYH